MQSEQCALNHPPLLTIRTENPILSPGQRIARNARASKTIPGPKPLKADQTKRPKEPVENQRIPAEPQYNVASLIQHMYNPIIQPNVKELSKRKGIIGAVANLANVKSEILCQRTTQELRSI